MPVVGFAALLLVGHVARGSDGDLASAVRPRIKEIKSGSEAAAAERAARALDAGRAYLALHLLEPAWLRHQAERFVREHRETRTPDAFRAEWNRVSATIPAAPPTRQVPVLVVALADAARARWRPTLTGSLPYAEDIEMADGLFYLGEADALGRLAGFYESLPGTAAAPPPAVRSIAPEIAELRRKVAAMHASADRESRAAFIPISATLRLASALDESRRHTGAMLQYLLARYRAALLVTSVGAAAGAQERLASMTPRLGQDRDHSIAALFQEMAAAHLDGALPPGPRGAAAIVDDVLPAYLAIVRGDQP